MSIFIHRQSSEKMSSFAFVSFSVYDKTIYLIGYFLHALKGWVIM